MSKRMEISPKLLGLTIDDNGTRYEYSYIPFTQSSKLVDERGFLVAELKRFGWFTLNFNLVADEKKYLLKCRAFNYELLVPEGDVFQTGGSLNFSNKSRQVTELKHNNNFNKYVTLKVFSDTHRLALIISSCLLIVRYLHGGS